MSTPIEVLRDVHLERMRQLNKWGVQRHTPERFLTVLIEEVGEVAQEINDAAEHERPLNRKAYRNELVQVAAVAVAAIEAIDAGAGL